MNPTEQAAAVAADDRERQRAERYALDLLDALRELVSSCAAEHDRIFSPHHKTTGACSVCTARAIIRAVEEL